MLSVINNFRAENKFPAPSLSINQKIYFCGGNAAFFVFPVTCAAEKHLVSEKQLNKRFFKDTGVVLAELNNRLPPVAEERRLLWRRGQRKFALQAIIFFGHRKSRECSPKIRDFRANGIPVQDRVVFFDTIIYTLISFDNAKE